MIFWAFFSVFLSSIFFSSVLIDPLFSGSFSIGRVLGAVAPDDTIPDHHDAAKESTTERVDTIDMHRMSIRTKNITWGGYLQIYKKQ
jgi:hypothetical protein